MLGEMPGEHRGHGLHAYRVTHTPQGRPGICASSHAPCSLHVFLQEDGDGRVELEKKRGEAYKAAADEHNELMQQITLKNRHLKDVIDQMRNIIWEINTMLAIRKA